MHINANGITFNYQIDGAQHAPWLIFSNSLATNFSMWDDQTRSLSGSFRILRYDQRGHGKTEAPQARYPFAILLADAIALMDAFEIRRAHFCGLSLGGATALGLAEIYPDRIDRVIVCDAPCASTPTSTKQWEERIVMAKGGGMGGMAEPTVVASISRPVLFLVGEKDPPNAAMREMHKELNGSQFVEIAGAGHISNIERPEAFTHAVEKFLMQPAKI